MTGSTQECIILWESTGAVTRVVDCPWSFLTGGVNANSTGPQRCYFVSSAGAVHVIDGAREMGKRTMCGTAAGETVNGTITSAPDAVSIVDSGATFPANCVGFEVYMLSGDTKGESQTITTRTSDTDLVIDSLSTTPAAGDRYSIAPIVGDLEFAQLHIDRPDTFDSFVRKVGTSISCSFSDLAGEVTSNDPNRFVEMGFRTAGSSITSSDVAYNSIPDKCVGAVSAAAVRLHPYLKFLGSNVDWELQGILVHGLLGISEAQSRQT